MLNNSEVKIGLIENEFGDTSIDSALIANYQPETILELNNGCICCSIFNEFSLGLQEMIKKNTHLEQLMIETSGVTDPGPVIESFFQDPELKRLFELCGTICLVDAVNFQEEIGGFEQQKQIIFSDLVIINKVSDADPAKLNAIKKKIASLNHTAQVVETNFGILGSSQFYILHSRIQDEFIRKLHQPFYSDYGVSDFQSFTLRFEGYLNEKRFREWFNYFASIYKKQIFRIKGVVYFENSPLKGIVQSVGGTTSISEGSVVSPYEPLENVLVFIGTELNRLEIEKMFSRFLTQEN